MFQPLESTRDIPDGLRDLFFLWRGAHRRDRPPTLDSLGLHHAAARLDSLVVTEILRGPDGQPVDFEFIYIGRTINGVLREEQTGHRMSSDPRKGPGSQIWEAYMAIAADPRPLVVGLPYEGPDPRYACTLELFLPLLGEADQARFVLAGVELLPPGHRASTASKPLEGTPLAFRNHLGGRRGN